MEQGSDLREKLHEQSQDQRSTGVSLKDLSFKNKYLGKERFLYGTSALSTTFFTWISPLISFGNKFDIDTNAVPLLKNNQKPKIQFDHLEQTFLNQQKSSVQGMTLVKAITKAFKRQIILLLLVALIYVAAIMYSPILMNNMMDYINSKNKAVSQSVLFFFAIFMTNFILSVSSSHIFFRFAIFGYNLSNTLSLLLFNKALKHPLLTEKEYSTSDIVNYSQVDAQRMTYMGFQLTAIIFCPIQIVIGLLLLYIYIGISFLVGTGVMIIMMLLAFIFSKIFSKANDKLLKAKDKRMKVTEEILQIMKFIKVSAQEKYFFQKLNRKREEQLQLNKKVNLMNIFSIMVFYVSSPTIIAATFLVYMALGNQITAAKAFTTIIIFQVLQYPLNQLPSALSQVVQIWASLKRIQKFLFATQIKSEYITNNDQSNNDENAIQIERGTFLWGTEKQKQDQKEKDDKDKQDKKSKEKQKTREQIISVNENEEDMNKQSLISENQPNVQKEKEKDKKPQFIKALNNVNLKIPSKKVTMVVGDIGSGKSSLLYSIISEMTPDPLSNPKITINGSIAFCPQKAWILSGTVKENILFFEPFDQQKFNKVLYYASLQEDLKILAKGVETEIGEKGVNLSGGQKARISLARALYSNKDIYLLDDVLSAVDVHVGKFLMEKTILEYLKDKTVLMPSHAIHFAEQTDNIIIMKKGEIVNQGSYIDLFNTEDFQQISNLVKKKMSEDKIEDGEEDEKILNELKLVREMTKSVEEKEKFEQKQKQEEKVEEKKDITNQIIEQLMMPEDHKRGQVSWEVYKEFFKISGGFAFFALMFFCMFSWGALSTSANIQIEHWCENPDTSDHTNLYIYIGLAFSSLIFVAIRTYAIVMSTVNLGRVLHKKILKSLLYASLTQFYNRIPLGRILNRLSKDLRQIDEQVAYALTWSLRTIFSLLSNLVICVYASTPLVLIPVVIVVYIGYRFQDYYLKTQRECVRLQNITTSPIVSGFTSAIGGVGTIRSYKLHEQFLQLQIEKVDTNKRMRVARQAMESWFSMRLAGLSFLINMTAIAYSLFSGNDNAALLGLLLTYAMNLNQDIINIIFSYSYLSLKMISVERILNFTKIEPEIGYKTYCQKWRTKEEGFNLQTFSSGKIQFKDYSARYRKDLDLVLKKINLTIEQGEKIGIVGRTGAGKSTLLTCLLRIIEPAEGSLLIDGKSIIDYKLKDLRYNMTMIDQEPTITKSSFRENLDPSNLYTSTELEEIIKECNLVDVVQSKGGLDALITGESLSVGEKQLLCICRAFLKKSKIVLIDEATANIDTKNDKLIQDVIADKFKTSTVLTIAHRLSTLKNSDKILVLGKGEILEWGSPKELLQREKGIYREMCEKNDNSYLE